MAYSFIHMAFPLFGLATFIIAIAALHDVAFRTVPNSLVLSLAALGILRGIVSDGLIESALAAAGLFLLATMCWRFGWLGGGDAKLLSAASLAMPAASVPIFVADVALTGGALALFYLASRSILSKSPSSRPINLMVRIGRVELWRLSRGGPLPYACAIAGGFLLSAH